MNPHDAGRRRPISRSYQNKAAWKRFLVIAAGPLTNYGITFAILAGLYISGIPKPVSPPAIADLLPGYPAAQVGMKPGDVFMSIDGHPVHEFREVSELVNGAAGQSIAIVVSRGDKLLTFNLVPQKARQGFLMGAAPKTTLERTPFFDGIGKAAVQTVVWNATIVEGLVGWAQGKVKMQLGGTVEVVAQTTEAAHLGAAAFFMTLAGISVFLALLNLLPVPALDGGRLFFLLIEMIRRRPVNQRIETAVHAMGFMALLTLMAFLTVNDVQRNLHLGGGDDGGAPSSGPQVGVVGRIDRSFGREKSLGSPGLGRLDHGYPAPRLSELREKDLVSPR